MSRPVYTGTLDRKKMPDHVRIGYEALCSARARSKKAGLPYPEPTTREWMHWWLKSLETFQGTVPSCGRYDHSKGYTWDNFRMQDMAENSREGMLRNKTHIKTALVGAKKVYIHCKKTGQLVAEVSNIRDAARLFSVSQRLIQFIVRGKYKKSAKIPFVLRGEA